jgi:hypothetical protein
MGTLERTWRLWSESFVVLSKDGEVLLFPVLSGVSALLLAAGFFVPLYRDGTLLAVGQGRGIWYDYAALFAWYYLNHFVILFFNSALVGCASIRLKGGDPTVADGLRIAGKRAGRIAGWALLASTVGVMLSAMNNRRSWLVRLIGAGVSIAWSLVTYLIVPVLILEDRGVYDSIYRSSELFRKQWGEELIGSFGFGLLNTLLLAPGLVLAATIWRYDPGGALVVGLIYVLFLSVVFSAATGVFKAALYQYAATGSAPQGFTAEALCPRRGIWRSGHDGSGLTD